MPRHGHARSDLRNLRLHERALVNLAADPQLRQRCLALAERWASSSDQAPSRPWLVAWRDMLRDWPIDRIAALVLHPDDGQMLRQCSPLGPALDPRERWAVLAAVRAELARDPEAAGR